MSEQKRHVRRLAAVAAVGLAAVLVAAGCNGGAAKPAAAGSSAPAHPHTTEVPAAQPLRSGERFLTLTMPQPYTPVAPNGGTDEYRCFLIDPKLTSTAYLTGSQFLPQNQDIVHHAIFFRVDPAAADQARSIDAADPGEGWTCFGDAGVDQAEWVAHWAPGVFEQPLPVGLGYPMPAGSLLVMQVHYNLLATGGKAGASDQSSIRLRLADGHTKMTALETGQLPAPVELPCAAGESGPLCDRTAAMADVAKRFGSDIGQTETALVRKCDNGVPVPGPTQQCSRPMPVGGTVYAVAGHMHLLGRSIKIELNPGTAQAKTLLDVTNYDFDNQAPAILANPVTIKQGDVLRVTCTHDAGLRKQLPQLRNQPARYVVWGDGTSDEMCLGLLIWAPAK
jgi:hypothetical protein